VPLADIIREFESFYGEEVLAQNYLEVSFRGVGPRANHDAIGTIGVLTPSGHTRKITMRSIWPYCDFPVRLATPEVNRSVELP
jgi:hypothetical protein